MAMARQRQGEGSESPIYFTTKTLGALRENEVRVDIDLSM